MPETEATPLESTASADDDKNIELRMDTVAREKPASDGTRGAVDMKKTKAKGRKMINDGEGIRLEHLLQEAQESQKPRRDGQGARQAVDPNERT